MSAVVAQSMPYNSVQVTGIAHAGGHSLAHRQDSLASNTAWLGVCVLVLVAPFEATRPLVEMPGQSISSVETALLLVFGAWAASMAFGRLRAGLIWRAPLTLPWLALFSTMIFAAWSAPSDRMNAAHMAGRVGLSFGVYLLTLNAASSARRVRGVFIASAAAGVLVGALVVLEYVGVQPVMRALAAFRPAAFLFGAQVRATGPFPYPTVASMYLEILFAFVSGLLLLALDAARYASAVLVALALAVMGEAVVLTFTRSGLVTIACSLAILGAVRYRRCGLDLGIAALAGVAAGLGLQVLSSHSLEVLRLRLTTEGVSGYAAAFDVPRDLTLVTGATVDVPVTVTNTGRTTWDPAAPQPFRLSYHWLLADEDSSVNWEGMRTDLPTVVAPGQRVSLVAQVRAPGQPGRYRLLWDVEEVQRRWFSREPDSALFLTQVVVTGPAPALAAPRQATPLSRKAERPGRLVLWRAAARMLAEHPLTGIGPDNFRLRYGPYTSLEHADPRVHSNNMYVELLVGGGALMGAALAWFLWRAWRLLRTLTASVAVPEISTLSAAAVAATVAVALHGLVDSFLSVTATYVLIAIALGLASACEALRASGDRGDGLPGTPHAYRV